MSLHLRCAEIFIFMIRDLITTKERLNSVKVSSGSIYQSVLIVDKTHLRLKLFTKSVIISPKV